MGWALAIVGLGLFAIGAAWFLQGIRVLPGSFMSGSAFWAWVGAFVAFIGVLLIARLAARYK
jgi:hypothetical protein